MSVTLTGNISPPLSSLQVSGDKSLGRQAANRSGDGVESLASAPKVPKTDSPPEVIRAHPTAPTEDMLQSLRDRELLAKRGQTIPESESKPAEAESLQNTSKAQRGRTPYDPEPEVSHSLDVVA